MNFYLDFEATQFSHRIISVGCVNDKGNSFYSLMQPVHKGKLTAFITELTGITQKDLANAPTADIVFTQLKEFIQTHSNEEETFFFVFGNTDKIFLEHTVKFLDNYYIRQFGFNLMHSLIDYNIYIKPFFKLTANIKLIKLYSYINQNNFIQSHNALDDAKILREVANFIQTHPALDTCPWTQPIINSHPVEQPIIPAAQRYIQVVPTEALLASGAKIRNFNTESEAINYIWRIIQKNHKNINAKKENCATKVYKAIRNHSIYYDRYWNIICPNEKGEKK